MKARLPDSLLGRGRNEQPLPSMSEASAAGSQMKATLHEHCMCATLEVCVPFASAIAQKEAPGSQGPSPVPNEDEGPEKRIGQLSGNDSDAARKAMLKEKGLVAGSGK